MATIDERRGTIFAGRYRLERKLGSGGMADVWLAEDQELGRKVAIKMLHERYANDVQFVERFRREATHAAGLSHPNVVSIYDRGEAAGSYFIVMEYVEGRTLKELLVARGPSPLGIAIDYTRQILSALRFAHRNGIVHRDIKPHNVIVDGEGRVKVMDFGIARAGAASQMTEAGSIIGTAQYLSPEQARGAPVDQTSDLYSTGIVLFAKTPQAASNLFANWNTPKIQKIYRALGQNIAHHDAYEILTPIGLVPHPLIGSVWAANPSGKPSKSLAKVISRTTSTTTFEVSLHSGRPHQIRIHLGSIGRTLPGDHE